MAEPFCVFSLTKDAGTVFQTFDIRDKTNHSFEPTWFLFFGVGFFGSSGFNNATAFSCIGFDDLVNRRCMSSRSQDNQSVPWPGPLANGDYISRTSYVKDVSISFVKINSIGTPITLKGFVSSVGFGTATVQWTVSNAEFTGMMFVGICGGGASYAQVASEAVSGSTGNQTFTNGLTGTPGAILTMIMPTGIGDNASVYDGESFGNFGIFNGAGCQAAIGWDYPGETYPAPAYRRQRTNRCASLVFGGGAHLAGDAHAVSIGSGNFVANWDVAPPSGPLIYMALFGVDVSIFALDEPSNLFTVVSGIGQTPECVMMLSNGHAASTAVELEDQFGVSATNGVQYWSEWRGVVNNAGPTQTAVYHSTANGLISATPTVSGATLEMEVDSVTLQTDGVRVEYVTVSGTTKQNIVIALGTATYSPVSPCSPTITVPPIYPPPPVTYENPCDMEEPRLHAKLETESVRYRWSVMPLRDTTAMGGFKEPRILSVGQIVRRASDLYSGAFSAQTAEIVVADTDRVVREISRARSGLRNCSMEIYVTGKAWSKAGGAPRALFAGKVYADKGDANLGLSLSLNDLLGVFYSVSSTTQEKRIPQRVVDVYRFPNAPEESKGLGIPIIGATHKGYIDNAAGTRGPGVVDCVYGGVVNMGGTAGIPGPGDLTAVVAALQASVTAGTCYQDYGPRIGFADARELQALGTVPSTYSALAAIIGGADLDALLNETAVTGGTDYPVSIVAGHAIFELLSTPGSTPPNGPSIWIDDVCVDPTLLGTDYWVPQFAGDATWVAQFGADLFTDILGTDGETERFTLIVWNPSGSYAADVTARKTVSVDVSGMESVGDATGTLIYNYWDLYYHVLNNFMLQNYKTGAWLSPLQFFFSDGVTLIDRILLSSFIDAKDLTNTRLAAGYLGRFVIGSGGERTPERDVAAGFNRSGGCLLADNDYGQLQIRLLDYNRSRFMGGYDTLVAKRDILPGFRYEPQPDWQMTQLQFRYGYNYHEGKWDRGFGGGGVASPLKNDTAIARFGVLEKEMEYPFVGDDATALAVATYYLALFAYTPYLAFWDRRGPCGLEDDLLRARAITHWNGYGSSGWVDHAVWLIDKRVDPRTLTASFIGLDVENQLT